MMIIISQYSIAGFMSSRVPCYNFAKLLRRKGLRKELRKEIRIEFKKELRNSINNIIILLY